jgi:acetyl-CoA carboxylase carboxyl transferase subunit alpha
MIKITAEDLKSCGICDHIVAEPEGGAAKDVNMTAANIAAWIRGSLNGLLKENFDSRPEKRYQKFRKMGVYTEK